MARLSSTQLELDELREQLSGQNSDFMNLTYSIWKALTAVLIQKVMLLTEGYFYNLGRKGWGWGGGGGGSKEQLVNNTIPLALRTKRVQIMNNESL